MSDFNRENVRVYHKQIGANLNQGKYFLNILLADLKQGDERIYEHFISKPMKMLAVMEDGLKEYIISKKQ